MENNQETNTKKTKVGLWISIMVIIILFLVGVVFILGAAKKKHQRNRESAPLEITELQNEQETQSQTYQKISLILPFDTSNNLSVEINPMGETIEHPEPENPGGHPGIDFIFNDETGERVVSILAMADGKVMRIENQGEKGYQICINQNTYGYCFGHLKSVEENLIVGIQVKQGQKVGEGSNVHVDFGYARNKGDYIPDRLCPFTYFTSEHQIILKNIPIIEKMKVAGFDTVCSGTYKEKNE